MEDFYFYPPLLSCCLTPALLSIWDAFYPLDWKRIKKGRSSTTARNSMKVSLWLECPRPSNFLLLLVFFYLAYTWCTRYCPNRFSWLSWMSTFQLQSWCRYQAYWYSYYPLVKKWEEFSSVVKYHQSFKTSSKWKNSNYLQAA